MGLSRKFLAAMGIEADKIDEIIAAHTETTEALKAQVSDARAEAENAKAEADWRISLLKELVEQGEYPNNLWG